MKLFQRLLGGASSSHGLFGFLCFFNPMFSENDFFSIQCFASHQTNSNNDVGHNSTFQPVPVVVAVVVFRTSSPPHPTP